MHQKDAIASVYADKDSHTMVSCEGSCFCIVFSSDLSYILSTENSFNAYKNVTVKDSSIEGVKLVESKNLNYQETYYSATIGPNNLNQVIYSHLNVLDRGYAAIAETKPCSKYENDRLLLCSNIDSFPLEFGARYLAGIALRNNIAVSKELGAFDQTVTIGSGYTRDVMPCFSLFLKLLSDDSKRTVTENIPGLTKKNAIYNVLLTEVIKRSYEIEKKSFLLKPCYLATQESNRALFVNYIKNADITPQKAGEQLANTIYDIAMHVASTRHADIVARSPFARMSKHEVEEKIYISRTITTEETVEEKRGNKTVKIKRKSRSIKRAQVIKPHQIRYLTDAERASLESVASQIDTWHADFVNDYLNSATTAEANNKLKNYKQGVQSYDRASSRLRRLTRTRFQQAHALYKTAKNGSEITDKMIKGPKDLPDMLKLIPRDYKGDTTLLLEVYDKEAYAALLREEQAANVKSRSSQSDEETIDNKSSGSDDESSDIEEEAEPGNDDTKRE